MPTPRFRLKNLATAPHVTQLLLDATGPVAELHQRMLEAGCEVDPAWKLSLHLVALSKVQDTKTALFSEGAKRGGGRYVAI